MEGPIMSAIWGMISYNGVLPVNLNIMMSAPLRKNYKVDQIQDTFHQNAFMGCGIQYVTPESYSEHLPILDQKHQILFAADCILDNRNELLEVLSISTPDIPDGNIMYQAYLNWGIDCLKHFRGSFSMAVYEYASKTLYLASDSAASRCLYYHKNNSMVVFSTLLAPIRSLCLNLPLNTNYIKDFLVAPQLLPGFSPTETPYQNIYKLNPGTYLQITKDSLKEISYWSPSVSLADLDFKNAAEYGSYFRKLYQECVSDVLRSSGNIGIALSSGLDSSSVGALAADCLDQSQNSLYAYTYVPFEKPTSNNKDNILDETEDVMKIVSMHPNIIPHFMNTCGNNCLSCIMPETQFLEIPFKAFGNMPSLCEIYKHAAEDGCRIVLTGQYGNSSVSYGEIQHILYDLYASKHYLTFLKYINNYAQTVKVSRKQLLKYYVGAFHENKRLQNKYEFSYIPDNPFLNIKILEDYPLEERFLLSGIRYTQHFFATHDYYQESLYRKSMYTYLGEVETKLGLKFGIVLRDPTRDMRILGFCYHMPYHYFAYLGTPRWLIRGNFNDILPSKLLNNWFRYGVQNSDWFLRIQRDWKSLYPNLIQMLNTPQISPFINLKEIEKYLHNTLAYLPDKDDETIKYLGFIYVLASFLNSIDT